MVAGLAGLGLYWVWKRQAPSPTELGKLKSAWFLQTTQVNNNQSHASILNVPAN
jgi:hypothetical protein